MRPWLLGIAGMLMLLAAGAAMLVPSSDVPAPASLARELRSELAELRSALDGEVRRGERLEAEVAALREQLWATSGEGERAPPTPPASAISESRTSSSPPSFDHDGLAAAGVDPGEAHRLYALWEDVELRRIELRDRAAREGWANSGSYRSELQALEDELREELSEQDYDRYLYATGRANRTRVTDVFNDSAGKRAGLRRGDEVLSYDGERVYDIGEVRDRISSRRIGDLVRIEVVRDGRIVVLDVPAGPLGVMLEHERRPPR